MKKTLREKNTKKGRKTLQKKIEKLEKQGYIEVDRRTYGGEFNVGKGVCLGCLFLPLAFFGYNSGEIEVVMEKKEETK